MLRSPKGTPGAGGSGLPEERVLITGDDVLIEYVTRLHAAMKVVGEDELESNWKT